MHFKMGKLRLTSAMLALVLLLATLGLAVPSINVSVQEIGVGSCDVVSPANWADVQITWNITDYSWGIWDLYEYTLNEVIINFSDSLPAGTTMYINVTIYGYNSNTGQYQSDSFTNFTVFTSGWSAGLPYIITNKDTQYSYYVSSFFGISPPEIVDIKIVLVGGSNNCTILPIYIEVQKIGVATLSFAPSGSGNVPIDVTERSGQDLRDYVINFTLGGDWSSLYPYVTDENGNRLYYWYFYDAASQKTWFWVKMNLSANQVNTIYLFYGNQSAYDATYFNPDKVFWFFDDFNGVTLNLSKWNIPALQNPSNYTVSNGLLELKGGQWLWTKQNFSGSFIIDLYANSLDSTAFPIFYVDSTNYGWAILLNTSLATWGATTYQLNNVTIRGFNLADGSWGAFYYPDGGSRSPIFGKDILITTLINVTSTQAEFYLYENGSLIATFTQGYSPEQSEPLGLGQWYEYNYTITGPRRNPQLTLSSIINTTSIYDWILVRPYIYPEPEVRVVGQTSGSYTFRIYFKP
ncbi:DUF2341 domain-containing protein [Thermococcus sp. GR7]|nr:DUF2341 domain-containing protein [Thermococcus sp. GR7]NJF22487.1 DUF2341 domain-containing protein [Thermococcus sp. GR5]